MRGDRDDGTVASWKLRTDTVLSSNCRAQYDRPLTRSGKWHLGDNMASGLAVCLGIARVE